MSGESATHANGRIDALDGGRGIAILMVLATHSIFAMMGRESPYFTESLGVHGVTIFFVLSGFLITAHLLKERDRNGSIDLRSFYIRRFFRLMPAAWAYLAFLSVVTLLKGKSLKDLDLPACLFFFRNYTGLAGQHILTGHFWTLSIEEQFYLVWPSVLLLGIKKARWLSLLGAGSIAGWRYLHWDYLASLPLPHPTFATQYRADALLIGCAAALFAPHLNRWLREWMAAPLILLLIWRVFTDYALVPLYESIAIALLLLIVSNHPAFLISRILAWRPLVYIGLLSYSLYLWQELIWSAHTLVGILILLPLVVFAAWVSYYFIEKPGIRLGRTFTKASLKTAMDVRSST